MINIEETSFDKFVFPEKLYKYRRWNNSKHKRILTKRELYFSSPFALDEQHECKFEYDFDAVSDEMIYKYVYDTAHEHGYYGHEEKHKIASEKVKTAVFRKASQQKRLTDYARQRFNESLSIFCACTNRDNFELWEHFASNGIGFCIGFNTGKMLEYVQCIAGKVRYYYEDNIPRFTPITISEEQQIKNFIGQVFSLPKKFEREDEYRLVKIDMDHKIIAIHPDMVDEVVLGSNIRESDKKEIIHFSRLSFPEAKIFQSKYYDDNEYYTFFEV